MASRTRFTSASSPPVAGTAYVDNVAGHLTTMYTYLPLDLLTILGTADAITATLDPPLDGTGLAKGMSFWLEPTANNTGAVTLAIDGGAAVDVVDKEGNALIADQLADGGAYLLWYDGTDFRVMSELSTGTGGEVNRQIFIANGTWTKPSGFDPDTLAYVQVWGGGAGGDAGSGGGGGGGAYLEGWLRLGDLGATEAVVVGQLAAAETDGNQSSFGAFLVAEGGRTTTSSDGGDGGSYTSGTRAAGGTGSSIGGEVTDGADATNISGGGAGGGGYTGGGSADGGDGGGALYGGGGGGGDENGSGSPGTGGVSIHGGNGGDGVADGIAPGGGGGGDGGQGARGEVRVTIF